MGKQPDPSGEYLLLLSIVSRSVSLRECFKHPVAGCVLDGSKVLAKRASVNVVWAGARHQFVGHVVDGDGVLVVCERLMDSVSDLDVNFPSLLALSDAPRGRGLSPTIS
jgi:hypothetical protein